MPKWNFVAMGQVGLTGWTRVAAKPLARAIVRRTGRPEAQILSLIGAGFLAIALIDFLREVDAVIAAGRTAPSASQGRSRRPHLGLARQVPGWGYRYRSSGTQTQTKRKSLRYAPPVIRVIRSGEYDRYRRRMVETGQRADGQFKVLRLTSDTSFATEFQAERDLVGSQPTSA